MTLLLKGSKIGINKIFTNILKKREFIKEYSKTHNLNKKELAMMGDDLQDLSALDEVNVFLPLQTIDLVNDKATYITNVWWEGAVREICDLIMS